MARKLPLYAEQALGELQATRGMVATEFERRFREEAGAVSCKAGCSNCCYHPILISIAEGIVLYRYLGQKGALTAELKKKLGEHADITAFVDPAVWMRARISCPLLDEKGRCRGYEGRPLVCRMTFSSGDPEKCDPQALDPIAMSSHEVLRVVRAFEGALLRRFRISEVRMPLSRALLLAERVLANEVDLAEIERILYREFQST